MPLLKPAGARRFWRRRAASFKHWARPRRSPGATPFYDPWESLAEDERRSLTSRRLAEYVAYARACVPFYRERLAAYRPASDQPLAAVPVLKSDDLRRMLPPAGSRLLADKAAAYTVFQSGGTTGFPKTTLFTHSELEALTLPNARGFHAVGLRRSDRVANLFAVGGLYMTFIHINRMLQQYGCMNFPFANNTPVDFMHTVAKLFKVNCFSGIASVVLSALRGMEILGTAGIEIEKIFYGGEHLYEADKLEIRRKFGTRVIAAPGYGTVDSWYIGYQCLATPTGVFHAHDDQCYLEIVDEATGRACGDGETGMAYATAFPRRLTPIVRYRVGDRARWRGLCPCGRTTPTFELLGRGDDLLRIGYDSLDYRDVQAAVARIPGLSGTVQMEKERRAGRDRLILRVETEAPRSGRARLAKALERGLLAERPTFRKAVAEKTVWPLGVELVAPGSLPRNPRTGKLQRVKDVL